MAWLGGKTGRGCDCTVPFGYKGLLGGKGGRKDCNRGQRERKRVAVQCNGRRVAVTVETWLAPEELSVQLQETAACSCLLVSWWKFGGIVCRAYVAGGQATENEGVAAPSGTLALRVT